MNYIKTEVYAGYNLSMKFPSGCKEVSIQRSRSREMRLQGRIKSKNGCDEWALIFAKINAPGMGSIWAKMGSI